MAEDQTASFEQARQAHQTQLSQELLLAAQQHFAELIDTSNYPNDLLDLMRQREERPTTQQNGPWRRAAARFFFDCGERLNDGRSLWFRALPFAQQQAMWPMYFRATRTAVEQSTVRSMWFQSMALLDSLGDRTPAQEAAHLLPRACVAIASLVYKAEVQADPPSPEGVRCMVDGLSQAFKASLPKQERPPKAAADATLAAMEQDVLRLLQWRIQIPTVETWLQAFAWRFDAATKQLFRTQVLQALQIGAEVAFHSEGLLSSRACSPENLARSLFCHGLLATGAVSWQSGHPVAGVCAMALEESTGVSRAELIQDSQRCEALLQTLSAARQQ